jgi:hypothetical protein
VRIVQTAKVVVADGEMEGAAAATGNAAEIAVQIGVATERRASALAEQAARGRTSVAEDVIRCRQAICRQSAIC